MNLQVCSLDQLSILNVFSRSWLTDAIAQAPTRIVWYLVKELGWNQEILNPDQQLVPISKAAYLTVAAFVVKRSFSVEERSFPTRWRCHSGRVSGGASYRAGLICQPIVFHLFQNNQPSNRTSRPAMNVHSADPWVTSGSVRGSGAYDREILTLINKRQPFYVESPTHQLY